MCDFKGILSLGAILYSSSDLLLNVIIQYSKLLVTSFWKSLKRTTEEIRVCHQHSITLLCLSKWNGMTWTLPAFYCCDSHLRISP